MDNIKYRMRKLFSNIKKEFKEDYEFLKEYNKSDLLFIKEFLQDAKEHLIDSGNKIMSAIETEIERRRSITDEFITKLKTKYLNQYVHIDLKDGVGSFEIIKVSDIKANHMYCTLNYSVSISNVDGIYSINKYRDGSIILYSELEEQKLKIITEEEYNKEFNNAIEYYKTLAE